MAVALLFDLDGTLVKGEGAGTRATARAVRAWAGDGVAVEGTAMAGRTDPQIFRDLLEQAGVRCEELPPALIELYVDILREEVAKTPGVVLPGVKRVLRACQEDDGIRLALATGNIEEGARIKLEPHGLNAFFPVGGYGCDSGDRTRLVATALDRVRRREGDGNIPGIVVGDTPRDVAAAHANNMPCIAVATGPYPAQALVDAGADMVLDTLGEEESFFDAVRTYARRFA